MGVGLNGPDIAPASDGSSRPSLCWGWFLLRSRRRGPPSTSPDYGPPPRAPAGRFSWIGAIDHAGRSILPRPVRGRSRWPRPADLGLGVAWDFPPSLWERPRERRLRLVPTRPGGWCRQPGTSRPTPSPGSLAGASPRLRRPVDRAAGPGQRALQPTLPGPPAATSSAPAKGLAVMADIAPLEVITFTPWTDPVVDRFEIDPSGHYSRIAWLPILGPTSWLLLGTISQHLAHEPAVAWRLADLARSRSRATRPAQLRRRPQPPAPRAFPAAAVRSHRPGAHPHHVAAARRQPPAQRPRPPDAQPHLPPPAGPAATPPQPSRGQRSFKHEGPSFALARERGSAGGGGSTPALLGQGLAQGRAARAPSLRCAPVLPAPGAALPLDRPHRCGRAAPRAAAPRSAAARRRRATTPRSTRGGSPCPQPAPPPAATGWTSSWRTWSQVSPS